MSDNNPFGDFCGNCHQPWPCDCDDPAWLCGICGSGPSSCYCSERVGYDVLTDEEWYAGEEALWQWRYDRDVDFARRIET